MECRYPAGKRYDKVHWRFDSSYAPEDCASRFRRKRMSRQYSAGSMPPEPCVNEGEESAGDIEQSLLDTERELAWRSKPRIRIVNGPPFNVLRKWLEI